MDTSTGLVIQRVPLESIRPDPANVRLHDEKNLDAIKGSLARFGQQKPIVVDRKYIIRAGNGTYAAAQALGWKEIDVVVTDLEGVEAAAFAIADNRTSDLSSFDDDALSKLLIELKEIEALDGTGFAASDLDDLLAELASKIGREPVDDPGPEEPPKKPVSRRGDLWILGEHRLLCGDSTSAEDVARLMAGDQAALIATDPPYCVEYTGADRPNASGKDWSETYREVEITDLGEFLTAALRATLPHLRLDGAIYVWHAHLQYPVIDRVFEEFGILRHQPIVWVKPSSTFTYAFYRWAHEPCIFGWRKGHKPPHYLPNELTSVWEIDWEGKQRIVGNEHPTQKPTRLFEIPMEQHTRVGEVALEAFSGSGSQLIAAEKLGRRCRAMEKEPAFVDVAVKRWEKATGKVATLEGSGESFAEVRAARGVQS